MVYDVFPCHLTLNYICPDDVNDVVTNIKELDKVVELLLNEVLRLLIQLVRYVFGEVEAYKLTGGRYREEVRRNLVYAPVAFRELGNRPILPKPLPLVGD